jgi:calcium-dependent protein kinase
MDEHDRKALINETTILRNMDHPNIVKMYEFFDDNIEKSYYIVTELCKGGTLLDEIIGRD